LIVYVDNIVLTSIDYHDISQMKQIFVTIFSPKILANSYISWVLR